MPRSNFQCFVPDCKNKGHIKVPFSKKVRMEWFEIAKKDIETAGKRNTYYCCDLCKGEIDVMKVTRNLSGNKSMSCRFVSVSIDQIEKNGKNKIFN